jgi:hypothetical protein
LGDETNSGWLGPYTSGIIDKTIHRWYNKGVYSIAVKAKDESGIGQNEVIELRIKVRTPYETMKTFQGTLKIGN